MGWVEPTSAVIVLLWLVLALRRSDRPGRTLLAYGLVTATAWAGEESCIRLYGFYTYSPGWRVFLGHVPLMVALIWPVVVLSAHSVVRAAMGPGSPWIPLAGGLLVLTDAALIEPVCVHAGLWHWTHPGLFAVPPVGVLGWALYAGLAMRFLEALARGAGTSRWLGAALLAPVGTHALLLASWWGLLRWIEGTIPPWPAVILAWILALGAAAASLRRAPRLARHLTLDRVPAALFFGALLLITEAPAPLVAWALASTPLWLLLTLRGQAQGDP